MKTSEAICLAILAGLAGWYGKTEYDKRNKVEPPVCPICDCKRFPEELKGLNNGFIKRRL